MLPTRFVPQQQSNMRKSRLEGKPSMLPKPRRPGSTDRLSTEARRPSAVGHRSSSAEPPRATFGARLSREASATKLPLNGRSRSQQSDRFVQMATTPLRNNHYSRSTTTPVRTPSEDRASRSWQTSVERALAFVTIKDQRPLSNVAWQRAAFARVQQALSNRAVGLPANMALMRPLTIARFVDITGALVSFLIRDVKLNTDNYVTKLPLVSKRLLYPGVVSKSWLRTVNTLHAFPHALALLAYLLDLVTHTDLPILDDQLYLCKDELSCLRRDYLYKCWIRFQDPDPQYEDLDEEYLQNLKLLLGNEEKFDELQRTIQKYESCLEDEAECAARADETRRSERRGTLCAALRSLRAARTHARNDAAAAQHAHRQHHDTVKQLDADIERAQLENKQLEEELEHQTLSIQERTKLLDEVDYAHRVQDSKRALAEHIAKSVQAKENELALWQKRTLDSCVEYKQGLIHLAASHPDMAELAIDENTLMSPSCWEVVSRGVLQLRGVLGVLADTRTRTQRDRAAALRRTHALTEEIRTKISELKSSVEREQQTLDAEISRESNDAATWNKQLQELLDKMEELKTHQENYAKVDRELEFWEKQEQAWRKKLSELQDYIISQRSECKQVLSRAVAHRTKLVVDTVAGWSLLLDK